MKKLALALLCIVSVAFFASCSKDNKIENPEPSIAVLVQDGYVAYGDTVTVGDTVKFGFTMASNAETQKELQYLMVFSDEQPWDTINLSGKTSYTYNGEIVCLPDSSNRIYVGQKSLTAIVTDIDGKYASATILLNLDYTDPEVEVRDFEWFRWGSHEQHGLEEFGLYWDQNRNAVIVPTEGTALFTGFTKEEWDDVTTESEKVQFILNAIDTQHAAAQYTGISTVGSGPVGDVIVTITADGGSHLIYIDRIQFGEFGTYGYPMTVYGQAK